MSASNRSPVMGLILIAGAVGIGAYLALDSAKPTSSSVPSSKNRSMASKNADVREEAARNRLEKSINTHIQMTNRQIEIEKEQIKVEANFIVPRVGEFVIQGSPEASSFSQRPDKNELNAVRDLRRDTHLNMSASDIIQSEIATGQAQAEFDAEYKKEYAKQFVENARRNGYDVKLSEDFRVIGVRTLRGASSY